MDVITDIRRERGRYRVTVSESDEFLVPVSLMRERPLKVGDALSVEEYDNWLMVRQYRHALDRAVAFLAARARSRREVEQKLLQAGYRPCTVEMVLYKLEREKLLDDADFARQWVEARSGRKLGRSRIAQELRRKGIAADEAEVALEQISDDDQLSGAIALAEKAAARIKPGEDPRKAAGRIQAMLARRGYSWDVAWKAVQQVMAQDDI
ncbi:MAG: regulatory protein RecX [Clostridia bacterium]|nr:regulatory protein RecX [Clostridia bacterium]